MRTLALGAGLVAATASVTARVVSQEHARRTGVYSMPSKSHDVLEQFVGKWTFEVTTWSGSTAQPATSEVSGDYRWIFGGRFLVGHFEGYVNGRDFDALDILGYDNFRENFQSFWIDNSTTAFTLASGHYDAGRKELSVEGTQDDVASNRRDRKFKLVYRFPSPGEMVMEVHREPPEGGGMYRSAQAMGTKVQ
jgi:hypothetical protein